MFLRLADAGDGVLLLDALYEAFNWTGVESFSREQLLAVPHISHYVDGWQRDSDFGVVAMGADGEPLGAAWCRLFKEADGGYGFVAEDIPELTMAVFPGSRGQGVGTRLLHAVLDVARDSGHAAVSLSVDDENAARRLYRSAGFTAVGRSGGSDTMVASVTSSP
jgi:GNAT superfamily N-acetyltransferase